MEERESMAGPSRRDVGVVSARWRIREGYRSVRGRIGPIIRLALSFELLRLLVFAPLAAGMLRMLLERWGRCSVGNFEIAAFLLSPPGIAALVALGTIALTTFYLEIAGLYLLLADPQSTLLGVARTLSWRFARLVRVGLLQVSILLALAAPFVAAIMLALGTLWRGSDLNGLIVLKPPIFWIGIALGASLLTVYAAIGGFLLLRWLFALPAVLFEPSVSAREALRLSRQRTRGRFVGMLRDLGVWLAVVVILSFLVTGILRWGSGWLLDRVGLSLSVLLPATATLLVLNAAVATLLSIVNTASFAWLVLLLYGEAVGNISTPQQQAPTLRLLSVRTKWLLAVGAVILVTVVAWTCHGLLAGVRLHDRLEITAHRAGGAVAPENTVAALRRAIEAGADWAEIDVQLTSDGALAVLHDSDLQRVGGVPNRVSDSTLAEIQQVDIGSRFGAAFRGERVPTLDELLAAAGDRIRLNIELKPHAPDDVVRLVDGVLEAVTRAGILDRCRFCSQSYESLQLARQRVPGLYVGFIAGARLGDLSQLDVNFLMVSQRLATRKLAEEATVRRMEVHAWTINDPDALVSLLDRGVHNVITDDPAAMRHRLTEIQSLSPAERILLRARNLLAD